MRSSFDVLQSLQEGWRHSGRHPTVCRFRYSGIVVFLRNLWVGRSI